MIKKNIVQVFSLALLLVLLAVQPSCNKFEELNTDTKKPSLVEGEALFSVAQKNLSDIMASTNVNRNIFRLFAQYWTETTYTDESNYDVVTRKIPDNFATYLYVNVLNNLKDAKNVINNKDVLNEEAQADKESKIAMINVLMVYAYSILFDVYGNMPYTEALDISNLTPKYDDAQKVYYALIDTLDKSVATFTKNTQIVSDLASQDLVYHGDTQLWKKMANSLKLRMAMMLVGVDAVKAKTLVNEAFTSGVFTSNNDNYAMKYSSSTPNTNPLWLDLVQSNRKDYVAANTIITKLNSLSDPRRPYYFDTTDNGSYVGGVYGASSSAGANSNPATITIQQPTFEALLLDYAEVQFYLAEAVERGFIATSTAESYYNEAIKSSIAYWYKVTVVGFDTLVKAQLHADAAAATYLARADVAYTTAAGDYKQKIGTQSWLAFYNRGYEGWTVWRRLGYPAFNPPAGKTIADIPVRLTYPINEQTRNGANVKAASDAIGGNTLGTKLWWNK